METIINIFQSLGVDESFFVQFGIVVALFFVLKTVLFGKLQYVLELRENKTTKKEDGANKKLNQAEEMAQKYKQSIEKVQQEAHQLIVRKKESAELEQKKRLKEKSDEIEEGLDQKRAENKKEIETKKTEILAQADELAQELTQKFTNS